MLRELKREDLPVYAQLSSICYTFPLEEAYTDLAMPEERLREHRGVFDEKGRLQSAMIQLDMECRFEGNTCGMAGIGGVVTDPQDRRGGAIRQIFETDLPRLYRAGYAFSALYPFSHTFYRKFGYELGILRREAEIPREKLRADLPCARRIVRVLPEDDGADMAAVYDAYIRDKNLAIVRRADMWAAIRKGTPFKEMKYAYVLYDGLDRPYAYWIGRAVREGGATALQMEDFAYTCPDGARAIFAMLRGMNEFGCIRARIPADLEARFLTEDPYDVQEKTSCGGMVRLIDARKALEMLPAPAISGRFVVDIRDGQIAENNGLFAITGDGRRLTVESTADEPADLVCGIGGLSAMTVGLMDFRDALAAGLDKSTGKANASFMAEVFRRREAHLHNDF